MKDTYQRLVNDLLSLDIFQVGLYSDGRAWIALMVYRILWGLFAKSSLEWWLMDV